MIPDSEFQAIADRAQRRSWSKDSFNCRKCPGEDCPAWWKTSWNRTTQDGVEVVPIEGCSFVLNQIYVQGTMAGTVINRQATNDARNQLVDLQKRATVGVVRELREARSQALQLAERREKLLGTDLEPEFTSSE